MILEKKRKEKEKKGKHHLLYVFELGLSTWSVWSQTNQTEMPNIYSALELQHRPKLKCKLKPNQKLLVSLVWAKNRNRGGS